MLELIIVCALMSIVVGVVYSIVQAGLAFYMDANSAMEIRQDAMVGINRLSVELRQSSMASVQVDSVSAVKGIVFASPRDATGAMAPTSDGKMTWQRYVCYYVGPYQGAQALIRKEETISPAKTRAPDPYGEAIPRTPAYFSTLAASSKVIARHLYSLDMPKSVDTVEIILSCEVSTRHRHLIELRTKVIPNLL